MPGWIPQWHPVKWLVVIVLVYLIWHDPSGWGQRVGDWLHMIPVIASRVGTFFTSI